MVVDPLIVGLLLAAALMHASWNALLKADRSDRLATFGVIMTTGTAMGLIAVPFLPQLSLQQADFKGTANRQQVTVSQWSGGIVGGNLAGTARVRCCTPCRNAKKRPATKGMRRSSERWARPLTR